MRQGDSSNIRNALENFLFHFWPQLALPYAIYLFDAPAYEFGHFVPAAVHAAAAQHHDYYVVVVVDRGSG